MAEYSDSTVYQIISNRLNRVINKVEMLMIRKWINEYPNNFIVDSLPDDIISLADLDLILTREFPRKKNDYIKPRNKSVALQSFLDSVSV